MTHLLHDDAFSIHDAGGPGTATLPEILARLGAGDEIEFPALRPHQFHPWHAFLVQLGALVAARTEDHDLARPAAAWRRALLGLAGEGGEDAWTLVVEDRKRPAFLQVPIPKGEWGRYKPSAETPDDLDMLVTAKNHDVKQRLMSAARPEHWVYALVTLQTFQGFSGRGNYGVARMNSGFGSRPGFAAAPGLGWSERFTRDVKVWLENRDRLLAPGYEYADGGHALLWIFDWNGRRPRLALNDCDPFFVEVCRRVRLGIRDGRIAASGAPSEKAFLDAKERAGDTGDVWTPVHVGDDGTATALTVSPAGLSYRRLQAVLFGAEWKRRPALEVRVDDGPRPTVIAQVMARGQGRTEGYHERRIPVPERGVGWLRSAADRSLLGAFAAARVERVGDVQRRILRPALCALLQGAPEDLNLRDDRPQRWLDRLDGTVDEVFFDDLWRDYEPGDSTAADANWEGRLYDLARSQLDDAKKSAPVPAARNYRAVATAEMIFEGAARKHLKHRFPPAMTEEGRADDRTTTDA